MTIKAIIFFVVYYSNYSYYTNFLFQVGWNLWALEFYMSLITGNIPIQSILGKLAVVPVGDTGTIPYHLCNVFPGAPGDRRQGACDGCGMWFVNSWALGWSRDM